MLTPKALVGKQIDEFRLDEFIAAGSMGMVFKAHDNVLKRTVALKLISKGYQLTPAMAEGRKRILREAQAAARLSHLNIVTVYRYGETDEFHYICMEYIPGKTLAQILFERKTIPLKIAVPLFNQILQALEAAHQEHIVHRDIKPANVIITKNRTVKVMDFGIAKSEFLSSTLTGEVLGTPYYMSPEQIAGRRVDIRSDLFGVGAVLFQSLTGMKPFDSETMAGLVFQIMNVDPISASLAETLLPPPVERFIKKALSKDPADRFQTPAEMSKELLRLLPDGPEEAGTDAATVIEWKGWGEDHQEKIQKQMDLEESLLPASHGVLSESSMLLPGQILPPPQPSTRNRRKTLLLLIPLLVLILLVPLLYFLLNITKIRPRSQGLGLEQSLNDTVARPVPTHIPASPVSKAILSAALESRSENVTAFSGQAVKITLRIRNSGNVAWRASEGFRYSGLAAWSGRENVLWRTVEPGTTIDFTETVITPNWPGTYFYGVVLKQGSLAFSPNFFVQITVLKR